MLRVGRWKERMELCLETKVYGFAGIFSKHYNKATALLKVIEINQSSEYKHAC
jgi:hypothetical protein